jgi:subtilase family serine protease
VFAARPSFESVYFGGAQYNQSAAAILETSLDVQWANAVAPETNILPVQATSMNPSDLMTAVNRLEQLAQIFGLSVTGFAVPDNHLQVRVRLDPDVAHGWSDGDVVRR